MEMDSEKQSHIPQKVSALDKLAEQCAEELALTATTTGEAMAIIKELRDRVWILGEYVQHKINCASTKLRPRRHLPPLKRACSCGLDAALTRAKEATK